MTAQIGMQAITEALVVVAVTNEAGEVLNRLADQRVHIVQEAVRHTGLAQEMFGYLALGAIDRIDANA